MILIDTIIPAMTGTVTFAAFAWAVKGHFRATQMPRGMTVISVISVGAFGTFAVSVLDPRSVQLTTSLIGVALHLAALGLFAWSILASRQARLSLAFSRDEPATLIMIGPYRLIRHPFYTSYIIFWVGCAIAAQSIVSAGFALLLSSVYAAAALAEERRFQASHLATDYRDYAERVGMFWPRASLLRP